LDSPLWLYGFVRPFLPLISRRSFYCLLRSCAILQFYSGLLGSFYYVWRECCAKISLWVIGLSADHCDISDEKQVENGLDKAHREWKTIFQAIAHPLLIISPRYYIMTANSAAAHAAGMTEKALVGKKCYEVFHGKDNIDPPDCCPLKKLLSSGQHETSEMWVELFNGVFLVSCTPIFNSEGCLEKVIHIALDITCRKVEEEKLHASLREKDLLLNEIHHRVKNNLQIISGLLKLQARASKNPEVIESFNESQNRIRSMALVHEKLYNSKDFSSIDLAGYMRSLSQELFQSHNINKRKIDLTIQTEGNVFVDINKAIPCGLVMNELISNTLKHAFPMDREYELQIIIREMESKEIDIIVRDDGIGLPEEIDIYEPRSVGLHLVTGLVKNQLNGQIEVKRGEGTEFRITFPI
jgi:PAS domain S-box-containing protein